MAKLTKNQKVAYAKVDLNKAYTLQEASKLVKEISFTKFDASVDLSVRLGVDPRKANQMVRGIVTLPHGTGKTVRVLVLCTPDKEQEAKDAGAEFVGLDDFIQKIEGGWTDVDIIITMPSVMAKVGKLGKILGPRNLIVPDEIADSDGYAISQQKRKLIEQGFGWAKFIGPIRQVMVRGLGRVDQLFVLTMAAYNLTRMRTLGAIRLLEAR